MKRWYRLWKKSGSMQGLDEHYTFSEEKLMQEKAENFAGRVGGGFNTHYTYGYEEVKRPPKEWLEKYIKIYNDKKYLLDVKIKLLKIELEDYSLEEAFN